MRKSIIITGAASGIGERVVRRLTQAGARLTLHTRRSRDRLDAVAARARQSGAEVQTVLGDLAEAGTGQAVVEHHLARFESLDTLIANAGFPVAKALTDMDLDDVSYAFRGNTFSFFELVSAAADALKDADSGRVVAVGSFTAHVFRADLPQFPASAASKGALTTATRSLALALAEHGITVNCVIPGYIEKDPGTGGSFSAEALAEIAQRIPFRRLGKADEVAAAIEFLCGESAAYITGQSLHVSGGLV